jgi:hypothetical protein
VCVSGMWCDKGAQQEANAQPIFHGQLPCRLLSATRDSQTALLTVSVALHTLHSHQKQQALVFHITDEVQRTPLSLLVCVCVYVCMVVVVVGGGGGGPALGSFANGSHTY